MASVVNEVQGGFRLRLIPGILDIFHNSLHFSGKLFCTCIEDNFAGALFEVNAFKAPHYVLLIFEHIGQICEALELFNFTQLLILLIKEETSL